MGLGEMIVSYAADVSNLANGAAQAKSIMTGVSDAASASGSGILSAFQNAGSGLLSFIQKSDQTRASLQTLNGSADGTRIISNVDVAQAQLTLLESKVTEARTKLQELQGAANAGEAVTGIPEAEAELTILEGKAQDARASLQELQTQEEATGSSASGGFLSGIGSAVQGISGFVQQVGMTVFGFQNLYNGAVSLASGLLQPAATAETTELSFENMLHSTSAAHQEMVSLNTYAASTPMQTQWVDTAAAKMMAFGIKTQSIIPDITAIGDNLSALGNLSDASLQSIVDIFGKINTEGKLTGGTMMELSRWGIPAWQSLSEAMGKPIPELQKMVSAGLIPASVALPALQKGMEATFGGGMAKQAQTFTGLLSTLQSNFQIAMAAFGGPLLKQAEVGLANLGTLLASPSFQSFATTVGTGIGNAISGLITGITTVVQVGAGIVNFFKQNELAALALLIPLGMLSMVLGSMAVSAIAAFIVTIPTLVAGFIAWTVAAGAAAIATLAATWPLLAIGAAIGLVVAGIILAVQHWSSIASFLQGAWQATLNWLQGALQAIGAFFVNVWQGIQSDTSAFIGFITNVIKVGFTVIFDVIFAPIIGIIALFKLLYDHNTYFKDLVDAITNFFKGLFSWATGEWSKFTSWLGGVWDGLSQKASSVFGTISSTVQQKSSEAGSWLSTNWNNATTTTGNFLVQVGNLVIQGWNFVSSVFSQAWSQYIAPPLQGIWSQVTGWFNNLASQFYNSGVNFINMLVQGITSGAGAIWNAVSGIAKNIWSALGFHSPAEKGPASDSDTWMPNLINMFVSGLNAGVPKMQAASYAVAQPLQQNLAYPIRPNAASVASSVVASSVAASGSTNGQTLIFEVDGRQLSQITNNHTNQMVRVKLGAKGYAVA